MSKTPHFSAPAPEEFARRFRVLMGWHDLTLREIAASTNNALSTVGTWKNGRLPAARATIERLAEIFHVPVEYLLTGQLREPGLESGEVVDRILRDLDMLNRALEQGAADTTMRQRTGLNMPPP